MYRFNKKQIINILIVIVLMITMCISNIYFILFDRLKKINSNYIPISVLIFFGSFIFILFFYIYLINMIADYEIAYYEREFNLKQMEMISQRKKVLKENNKKYLENKRKEEKILNNIYEKILNKEEIDLDNYSIIDNSDIKFCENIFVDALLYSKYLYALEKGISFEIDVIYDCSFVDNIDLNTILFNLIDNAFEASFLTSQKDVVLKIRKIKGIVCIYITNSKQEKNVQLNETTKKDKKDHGIGLKIVREIIKDYQGKMEYLDKGKTFELNVTLFRRKE